MWVLSENKLTMRQFWYVLIMLSVVVACEDKSIENQPANCGYSTVDVSRAGMVRDLAVTVVRVGSNFQLIRAGGGNGAPLGACNLATDFRQDSVKLLVSGYFLTWPELKYINISPLPFEVVDARRR
ncbi:hypothetical protein [Spirosoma montaniterrae]|uniref:Uncharacterized protein n=1 Tax=Spirosoma montaniterrae TaxID=1178516 RepID=A0A1P9WSS4_9BACT|nr:hypothetical protein [Spirosoma montaniterrae]AQG78412.1 hypothetical protein AWR27_03105 [Spirosoma montaniterrae]